MTVESFRQRVIDAPDDECFLCGRTPAAEANRQQGVSIHHINGDAADDRAENRLPVCQSCHVNIHRRDEPPYRLWHRQLSPDARHGWNQYTEPAYDGPQLSFEEAYRRFGDDGGTPDAERYKSP